MSGRKRKAGVALNFDAEASASFVCDQRTSAKTKSTYKSHLKKFVDYMSQHFPSAVAEDGSLILPLQWDAVRSFNGYMASAAYERQKFERPNEVPDNVPEPFSSSLMNGFKSAVMDVYRRAGLKMDQQLDLDWGNFLGKLLFCIVNMNL
jgi:hypothetical protein